MKVFISYSTDDVQMVNQIAYQLRPHTEVFYWNTSKVPGQEAWPSIFQWIDQCDLVLAVITDSTVSRAMSVGQEIGRAKAMKKIIVPLVAPEVPNSELGCLSGVTYERLDHHNPGPALENIKKVVLAYKQQLEAQQAMFVIGGVVALILLASSK
jgi:TIR domain